MTGFKVTGEEGAAQKAAQVLETLKKMRDNHEIVNENVVSQAIDLVDDGAADEAVMVMKDVITLTNKGKPVKCKTIGQRNYINAIKDHAVTICIGPAGTGKTYLAIAMAVDALKREEISRIILTRPAVEAGEHLGFLPGDLQSKVDPYLRPLYDALFEMLGEESFNRNLERGIIEVAPLAYMRGRTLNNSFVILDEAQNASLEQMFMVLTRLGEGSKIIVTGDVTQVDLMDRASGLERSAMILKDVDGIAISRLSNRDVVRHKLVRDIIKAFENYREKEDIKQRRRPMTLNIEEEVPIPDGLDYKKIIHDVVCGALEFEDCPYEVEVNVILTSNEEIALINRDYRDLNQPTDVLSFPMIDYVAPEIFSVLEEYNEEDYFNPESGELMLGDIIISMDKVYEQAEKYGHSIQRELGFLVAHSMLHLFGYDHMEPEETQVMEEKQRDILKLVHLSR